MDRLDIGKPMTTGDFFPGDDPIISRAADEAEARHDLGNDEPEGDPDTYHDEYASDDNR